MIANKTIVKITVIAVIFIAALVFAIIHVNSLDPNCPYCDIDELNKHGDTLEYTEGSENKTFVLEGGYHWAEYTKSDKFSVHHEEEYREWGKIHHRDVTDLSIDGSQIVKITINE